MSNREDEDPILESLVGDREWKTPDQHAPHWGQSSGAFAQVGHASGTSQRIS